jgi:hypothetical protein
MVPRINNLLDQLNSQSRQAPNQNVVLLFTSILVVGLMGVVPVFTSAAKSFGGSLSLFALLAVSGVAITYLWIAISQQQIFTAAVIATIVTATFGAELPLLPGTHPVSLGPQLYLLHPPLIALCGILVLRNSYRKYKFKLAELFFGGFVIWSIFSTVLAPTSHLDTAIYYIIFMITLWLLLTAVYRAIRENFVTVRQTVLVFLLTMFGHTIVAIAQLLNQSSFGITVLGETHRGALSNTVSLGPLEFAIGIFVSGFTGGNAPLSVLLVVAIPLLIGIALDYDGKWRYIGLSVAVMMVAVLRATGKDASRISLLIALIVFVCLIGWMYRGHWTESYRGVDGIVSQITFSVFALLFLFYPSKATTTAWRTNLSLPSTEATSPKKAKNRPTTKSKSASKPAPNKKNKTAGHNNQTPNNKSTPNHKETPSKGPNGGNSPTNGKEELFNIPFISTRSLGVRFRQYFGGIKMTIDHPLTGVGPGQYSYFAPQYGLPANLGQGSLFPLHSVPLAVMAETGLPGLALWIGVAFDLGRKIWHRLQTAVNKFTHAGFAASFIGGVAAIFWVSPLRMPLMAPLWILAGATLAMASTQK